MLVERKSKQTDKDNRPKPMSSLINNPAYSKEILEFFLFCNYLGSFTLPF
jgi:hypothetical protein